MVEVDSYCTRLVRKMLRGVLIILILLAGHGTYADKTKRALKFLQKGDYDKVVRLLDKSLEEEELNPIANYTYSLLFARPDFESYNLQLSYTYILKAIHQLKEADDALYKDMFRKNITKDSLIVQRITVEKEAYHALLKTMTLDGFNAYIDVYKGAEYVSDAIFKRDSIAFEFSVNEGTWESYLTFADKYTSSVFEQRAKARYYELHYEDYFVNKDLITLKNYVRDFPESPYAEKVMGEIFALSCLDGRPESYLDFIKEYRGTTSASKVKERLLALDDAFYENRYTQGSHGTTLTRDKVFAMNVFPYFEPRDDTFHYWSVERMEAMPVTFDGLSGKDRKSIKRTPILSGMRNGKLLIVDLCGDTILYAGKASHRYITGGFLALHNENSDLLLSPNGDTILAMPFDEVEILEKQFLLVTQRDKKGIFSFTGIALVPIAYHEIEKMGSNWALFHDKGVNLVSEAAMIDFALLQKDLESIACEDVERLSDGSFLIFEGHKEGLLSPKLETIVPLGNHRLETFYEGVILTEQEGTKVIFEDGSISDYFDAIDIYDNRWLVFKNNRWLVKDLRNVQAVVLECDSLEVLSTSFFLFKKGENDSILSTSNLKKNALSKDASFQVVSSLGNERRSFFRVVDDGESRLFDHEWNLLLTSTFDNIIPVNNGLFVVESEEKKGIANKQGKLVLEIEYDGIAGLTNKALLVAKKGELYLFNVESRQLSKYTFEARPTPITEETFLITVSEKMGFMTEAGTIWLSPRFDVVAPWNDTKVLVKENGRWSIFDIERRKFILEGILSYDFVINNEDRKIIRYFTETGVGIMDSEIGIVTMAVYNDILNIGDETNPFYMAYKEKSNFFTVEWITEMGYLVLSKKYKERDFEKVFGE